METLVNSKVQPKGGEFLVSQTEIENVHIPEENSEEHLMIAQSLNDFINERIFPNAQRIEKQEEGLNKLLMREAGELGFLSSHIPEQYGGLKLDFISETVIAEGMGSCGSFSVSYNAHTGIGMLPILYFGTEIQKQKYLPKLSSGEWVAAYCLTEPGSGSDALSAKTKAEMSEDGLSYILNGQKMWISNAGFADIFIVFAQLDGDKFTGFIVDKDAPGLILGEEEMKLGIKGSSTRQVYFENTIIPKENLLGEIGKGHLIAFNVLNIGRYKLGVSCLGGCQRVTKTSYGYAKTRHQFNKTISEFGAIKHKLAEQTIKNFALESATYRLAGIMENDINARIANGVPYGQAKLESAEEFALECSIIKVLGSEVLDYVVDESVQIHGGMGYSEEGDIARAYRDARINRIFEGTNEINRLLMLNLLFKRAMKGQFDIAKHAMAVQAELMQGASGDDNPYQGNFEVEHNAIQNFKKVLFMLLGIAGQKAMSKEINLKEYQEPVMNLADMIIDIFAVESTLLRAEKLTDKKSEAILKVFVYETAMNIYKYAFDATGSIVDESMFGAVISGIKKLTKYPVQNTMKLRRHISNMILEEI